MNSVLDRFWAKVDRSGDCWIWQGARGVNRRGMLRPQFSIAGKSHPAYRALWILLYGPLPDRIYVLHKCDNPMCVNPDHLFTGTQSENMLDAKAKGRLNFANSKKTHCPQGHPYSGDNLVLDHKGRDCRACRKVRHRVSKERASARRSQGK